MSLWSPWSHIHASWFVKHSVQTTPRHCLLVTLMASNGVDRSEHFGVKYIFIKLFSGVHIRQVNILYHGVWVARYCGLAQTTQARRSYLIFCLGESLFILSAISNTRGVAGKYRWHMVQHMLSNYGNYMKMVHQRTVNSNWLNVLGYRTHTVMPKVGCSITGLLSHAGDENGVTSALTGRPWWDKHRMVYIANSTELSCQGLCSLKKTFLFVWGFIIDLGPSLGCLRCTMWIPIHVRRCLLVNRGPGVTKFWLSAWFNRLNILQMGK